MKFFADIWKHFHNRLYRHGACNPLAPEQTEGAQKGMPDYLGMATGSYAEACDNLLPGVPGSSVQLMGFRNQRNIRQPLFFVLVFSMGLFLPGFCQGEPKAGGFETQGVLLFRSGFEPESRIENASDPSASHVKIVGQDHSVAAPNDWVADIDHNPHMGRFSLQFHRGDISMRNARIIPEPGNPDNHVLHFWMNQPAAGARSNARIQANIYASDRYPATGIKALYQTVRLFLHEDMEVLRRYPHPIRWLTILEIWNNIQWRDDPYPFRLKVDIGKPTAEPGDLFFRVMTQDYEYPTATSRGRYVTIWHEMNTHVPVPLGQWITLEYFIREGDGQQGRFFMAMTPDGGARQVLFDI